MPATTKTPRNRKLNKKSATTTTTKRKNHVKVQKIKKRKPIASFNNGISLNNNTSLNNTLQHLSASSFASSLNIHQFSKRHFRATKKEFDEEQQRDGEKKQSPITPELIRELNEKELAALEADNFEIDEIHPHNPEEGIPCNFIELPSTSRHLKTVKPWSVMSFTDNIPKSLTFEQMQQQMTFYLENGGRVMKLYPGYEPYQLETIATSCRINYINPNDLTLILPISAHEIKTGMHAKSHPVNPRFYTKEDKINYIKQNCPYYVPHRRGLFVHKIIQQLTTKIDGLNLDKTLNLPIEFLYDDYPDNYDPRVNNSTDYLSTLNEKFKDKNISFTQSPDTQTTTITLHDLTKLDPMDYLGSQELPDGHMLKPAKYDGSDRIFLPSGRYPGDRLNDKVHQVTAHLGSENVDLVVINELEHIHEEFMGNVYDTLLESFFQCELLVMDGKTRGYGVQSRLISTHYNHDHYISPYKMLLISNFCAELARLYRGLPTKDPYFHPQQIRMLMDVCMGAVLPPQSIVDDMYGEFKDNFMTDLKTLQQNGPDAVIKNQKNRNGNNNNNNNGEEDDLISGLKSGLGLKDNNNNNNNDTDSTQNKTPKMSDFFTGLGMKPLQIDDIVNNNKNTEKNGGGIDVVLKDSKTNTGIMSGLTAEFLLGKAPATKNPNNILSEEQRKLNNAKSKDENKEFDENDQFGNQNDDSFASLTPQQKIMKKQFETIDGQIGIVLEAKRLALLAGGSTPEDRVRLHHDQQLLLENHMILPEEKEVISDQNLDLLYSADSKYLLIDDNEGERGKYKDLRIARRVLELKGESAEPLPEKLIGNKKEQLLLQGDVMRDELFGGNNSLNVQNQQQEQVQPADPSTNENNNNNENQTIENITNDTTTSSSTTTKQKKTKKQKTDTTPPARPGNEDYHFKSKLKQLENDNNANDTTNPESTAVDNDDENNNNNNNSENSYYESAIKALTIANKNTNDAITNALQTNFNNYKYYNPYAIISKDKLRAEVVQFQLMQSLQKLLPNEDSKALVKAATGYFQKVKKEISLAAARRIAIHKIDSFLTHGLALQQLYPHATIYLKQEAKRSTKKSQNNQVWEDDVLNKINKSLKPSQSKVENIAQIQQQIAEELTPLQRLQLTVTPKMIANWEQWKKGERKRQFNNEVSMALEREYANLFQNIIYKTLSFNPDQDVLAGDGTDKLKMPELKLGQLFNTKSFHKIYSFLNGNNTQKDNQDQTQQQQQQQQQETGKDNKDKTKKKTEELTTEEIQQMTAAYALLNSEQQQELQRIATYIPLYTTTGILPLFPQHVIEKHHALRNDLIKQEMKRQLKIQDKYMNENDIVDEADNYVDDIKIDNDNNNNDDTDIPQQKDNDVKNKANKKKRNNNKQKTKQQLFDPNYEQLVRQQLLLTQDRTWYDDNYVPLWLCNKRQSRLMLLEPEVNIGNYNFTIQKTHPVPVTKSQWKLFKQQQQTQSPVETDFATSPQDEQQQQGENQNDMNDKTTNKLKKLVQGSLYHLDTNNLTLITPHQFTIQHGLLLSPQNTFDVTVDDKTIRLLDSQTVNKGIQQQLSDYLTHALSFLRTLERSYPYQARDSLAKNLPPALAVSTAQMLQMELPHISTVPEMENVLYGRLLPQIQGAVDVLEEHEEFREFASQLAVAGEKTKNAAESCIFSYNTPIVNAAQRQLQQLHHSLDVLEDISMQLLWVSLGLGFDSVGVPQATLSGMPTTYLQHIFARDHGQTSTAGQYMLSKMITQQRDNQFDRNAPFSIKQLRRDINVVNDKDISKLHTLTREEALQVLQTATLQVIPILKKKLADLEQHLQSTPVRRQQDVAIATSERHYLAQNNIRQFHMITSGKDGMEIDEEELKKNPQYRRYLQELEISKDLQQLFNINPFVPAELAFDEQFKIETQAQNHLLLLQYDNIHGLDYTKAAQH